MSSLARDSSMTGGVSTTGASGSTFAGTGMGTETKHSGVSGPAPRIIDIVVSDSKARSRSRRHENCPQKGQKRATQRQRQTPAQAQEQGQAYTRAAKPVGQDEVDSLGDVFRQMLIEHLKSMFCFLFFFFALVLFVFSHVAVRMGACDRKKGGHGARTDRLCSLSLLLFVARVGRSVGQSDGNLFGSDPHPGSLFLCCVPVCPDTLDMHKLTYFCSMRVSV